jgi:hypothetical protein
VNCGANPKLPTRGKKEKSIKTQGRLAHELAICTVSATLLRDMEMRSFNAVGAARCTRAYSDNTVIAQQREWRVLRQLG